MSNKGARMTDSYRQAAEAAVAAGASKATYTGSATTMAGWALSNEFIAVGGFALAVLGFVVNLYFKIKDDRRQQRAHEAHMHDISTRKDLVADAVSKEVASRLSRN
jgi:TnpA family transposase